MRRPSRQVAFVCFSLCAAIAVVFLLARSKRTVEPLAFWYEPIGEDTTRTLPERFSGVLNAEDLKVIERTSNVEVVDAFRGYPVAIVGRSTATYRVRVVDTIGSPMAPSGESYTFPGLGGQGFVNFRMLAHGAVTHAPAAASRDEIVEAIGRGIGRAAVHEFAHQLLGRSAPIDDSTDVQSYEYGSASRREQYYGPMRWDIAAPMLRQKFANE